MIATNRTYVDPDWSRGAVSYALRENWHRYYLKYGAKPSYILASNNMGNFFPFVLCYFAIRHNLVIKFVPNDGYKPFFYFSDSYDEGGETNAP